MNHRSDIAKALLIAAENPPPSTCAPHAFVGRLDRWCEICNRPDRDPVHSQATPPDVLRPNEKERKQRVVRVAPEFLADALRLPAGSRIVAGLISYDAITNHYQIIVEHEEFDAIHDGERLPCVDVILTATTFDTCPHREVTSRYGAEY